MINIYINNIFFNIKKLKKKFLKSDNNIKEYSFYFEHIFD